MIKTLCRWLCANLVISGSAILIDQQELKASAADPQINFSDPLGGQQGTTFEVEVNGLGLTGAYAVWTGREELTGRVKSIEELKPQDEKADASPEKGKTSPIGGQRLLLEITAGSQALPGSHEFRIVCRGGVTNAFTLQISVESVVSEKDEDHDLPEQAQAVEIPVLINGKLRHPGEVDYYSFEAKRGQELVMEVGTAGRALNPVMTLYDRSGSWFDSKRLKRLAFNDNSNGRTRGSRLRYLFATEGRYLIAVGAFVGLVTSESAYQLRITPVETSISETEQVFTETPAHPETAVWTERTFTRELRTDRLLVLWNRTVRLPQKQKLEVLPPPVSVEGTSSSGNVGETEEESLMSAAPITVLKESEPNDAAAQAMEIKLPAILEGTIAAAGDIDRFSFRVTSGQALAFEIQTPLETPNRFNPQIAILDANDAEVADNVYSRLGGDGDDWIISLEPKLTYTFEREGNYQLQIGDVTSRLGESRFVYRLLVRPQIPHVGAVEAVEDQANLVVGKAKKLTVRVDQEEGFSGDLLIDVENLPLGVKCLAAAGVEPEVGPELERIHPGRFLPGKQKVTLMLMTEDGTPLTQLPSLARLTFRPIVGGNPGLPVIAREFPVMVLSGH